MKFKTLVPTFLIASCACVVWADDSVLGQQSVMVQMLKQYDTNNDGVITRDELVAAKTAEFKKADTDNSGFMSWAEFKAVEDTKLSARLKTIYSIMDADGKDGISVTEFANASPERPASQANTVFALADTDKNNSLSLEEFTTMRSEGSLERLMWMFAGQDTNADKQISMDEFTASLKPATPASNTPANNNGVTPPPSAKH